MRKRFFGAFLVLASAGWVNSLPACGDKYLVETRVTRSDRAPVARKPAAILIYPNPTSEVSRAMAAVPLDDTLRKAGYRPTTVKTSADFDAALTRGSWDLVLVGIADAHAVSQRVQGNSGVLPVLVNPTKAELQQTKKLYPVFMSAPAKSQMFLDAVDDALASQPKTQTKGNKSRI